MLGRVLRYGEKMYALCTWLGEVRDGRTKPRVSAGRVALNYVLLILARLGSLNAMEQRQPSSKWSVWLGGKPPSADVMGDVATTLDLEPLRAILRAQHAKGKRNKAFKPGASGLRFLILDGHEGVASFRRKWSGCLERVVHFLTGDRTQYYFRYVAAYLTNGKQRYLLDAEVQLSGEGEIACAIRLVKRILQRCPSAFDVACGDNLYMDPELWKLLRAHRKHVIAVLKNESRDLLQDARALFDGRAATRLDDRDIRRLCWDLSGFTTWPQCGEKVRVVRSFEQTIVRRQNERAKETLTTEWFWVTTLPVLVASTETIVHAGHGRWGIENYGFNEIANQWHGDHGYRYNAHALLACTLLLFIAYNLFHAFLERNLKPQVRAHRTEKYWADLIAAELILAFHRPPKPT